MDWWLSPELYLRRPPAQNEQYRVDRMLQAAAERGVQVSVAGLVFSLTPSPSLPVCKSGCENAQWFR
jgi:hypothetical protein